MSWEAWGDDDDGSDAVREHVIKQLIEDGWLDDVAADKLKAGLRALIEASTKAAEHLEEMAAAGFGDDTVSAPLRAALAEVQP